MNLLEPSIRLFRCLSLTMKISQQCLESRLGGNTLQPFPRNGLQNDPWVMR